MPPKVYTRIQNGGSFTYFEYRVLPPERFRTAIIYMYYNDDIGNFFSIKKMSAKMDFSPHNVAESRFGIFG